MENSPAADRICRNGRTDGNMPISPSSHRSHKMPGLTCIRLIKTTLEGKCNEVETLLSLLWRGLPSPPPSDLENQPQISSWPPRSPLPVFPLSSCDHGCISGLIPMGLRPMPVLQKSQKSHTCLPRHVGSKLAPGVLGGAHKVSNLVSNKKFLGVQIDHHSGGFASHEI